MGRDDFIDRVEDRVDEHLTGEHPRPYADSDEPTSSPDELRHEQEREADDVAGPPTLPFMTGSMWRGMVTGALVGMVIGAVIAAPVALIPFFDLEGGTRLVIVLIAGAAGGAAAGAVYGGGRFPELRGESLDADNTPSAGSSLRDPGTDSRGRPRHD